ncbi:MAG: nucleotide exchange factor GrpE [Candidatus Marsarchaeota archaeon]|nr:nucleotide exchange factor GrpE [Candidatus Marsarchaeota archaeon]MCL5412980.1 nucleotide exchange factor GrpE [Candidatus Marsarchaeota archaeon]
MEEEDQENKKDANAEEEKKGETAPKDSAEECAEVKDRLLRLAAEFDNYKKRVAKDMDGAKDIGRADTIARLLPTLDEFELALGSSDRKDEHMKGIELVFSNFVSALKGQGLREIEVDGRFDPYRHEIVLSRDSDRPEGEILEVIRKGYMLNNIMLRPASVIISRGKGVNDDNQPKNE